MSESSSTRVALLRERASQLVTAQMISRLSTFSKVSSYFGRVKSQIPDKIKTFLGTRKIIDEDVAHLVDVRFQNIFSDVTFLILSYTDGVQIFDVIPTTLNDHSISQPQTDAPLPPLTSAAAPDNLEENFYEIYSCAISGGVATACVIPYHVTEPISAPNKRGGLTNFSHLAPLLAVVPLKHPFEIRIMDPSHGTICHRLELPGPITELKVAYSADQSGLIVNDCSNKPWSKNKRTPSRDSTPLKGVCVLSSHRQIRVFDLFDFSQIATLAVAPGSPFPPFEIFKEYIFYEDPLFGKLVFYDWSNPRITDKFPLPAWNEVQVDGRATDKNNLLIADQRDSWLDCGTDDSSSCNSHTTDPEDEKYPDHGGQSRLRNGTASRGERIAAIAKTDDGYFALTNWKGDHVAVFKIGLTEKQSPPHDDNHIGSNITDRCTVKAKDKCSRTRSIGTNSNIRTATERGGQNEKWKGKKCEIFFVGKTRLPSIFSLNPHALATAALFNPFSTFSRKFRSDEDVVSSISLRFCPESQILELIVRSNNVVILAHKTPTALDVKLPGCHTLFLGSPLVKEPFWPDVWLSGNDGRVFVISRSGVLHLLNSSSQRGFGGSMKLNRLPSNCSSPVTHRAPASLRVCRPRHHYKERLWVQTPKRRLKRGNNNSADYHKTVSCIELLFFPTKSSPQSSITGESLDFHTPHKAGSNEEVTSTPVNIS